MTQALDVQRAAGRPCTVAAVAAKTGASRIGTYWELRRLEAAGTVRRSVTQQRYVFDLRSLPNVGTHEAVRLRRLLKAARRMYGFRVAAVRESAEETRGGRPP